MIASHFGINLRNINQSNLQWNKFFPYLTSFGKSLWNCHGNGWMASCLVVIVASGSKARDVTLHDLAPHNFQDF